MFNKHLDTIFLDKESPNFTLSQSVNVILSPSLYWVKKVSLPVKYLRDVKSLLPSLFEEILPDGVYSYYAYKEDENFYIFAYEDKHIIDTLNTKGVSSSQVHNVYFAQSEFSDIKEAISISQTQSLYKKDEILVLLPSNWISNAQDVNLKNLRLSKKSVTLKQFSHLVNDKSVYTVSAIGLLLLLLIASEYFITSSKISSIESAKETTFVEYGLKPTMFQNRSLLKGYKKTDNIQTNLRVYLSDLLQLNLSQGVKISLLEVKKKSLKVEFVGITKSIGMKIVKDLQSKKIPLQSKLTNKTLHLEITL